MRSILSTRKSHVVHIIEMNHMKTLSFAQSFYAAYLHGRNCSDYAGYSAKMMAFPCCFIPGYGLECRVKMNGPGKLAIVRRFAAVRSQRLRQEVGHDRRC